MAWLDRLPDLFHSKLKLLKHISTSAKRVNYNSQQKSLGTKLTKIE